MHSWCSLALLLLREWPGEGSSIVVHVEDKQKTICQVSESAFPALWGPSRDPASHWLPLTPSLATLIPWCH